MATKLRVVVDDRTQKLTDAMLECRAYRHDFRRVPPSRARIVEMIKAGYKEVVEYCACGARWVRVFDRRSGSLVEQRREYDKDYLMPAGSGRMSKDEARKALWVREDKQLYR